MLIEVDCYSGWRGDETPRAIRFRGRTVAAVEVIDRWLAPDHRYFKIRGDDGGLYIIRHDVAGLKWELTFYDADRRI
ncbi:MAG: hypothetical protein R6V84_09320 [Desulfobacterales bacterium]